MGLKKKCSWRGKVSKWRLNKIRAFELDSDKAYSFVCDEIILSPKKSNVPSFKDIDLVICNKGYPMCKLKGGSDILFLESSSCSFKMDVMDKNGLTCVYPSIGRLRVDWNGFDLHVTRLSCDDETV